MIPVLFCCADVAAPALASVAAPIKARLLKANDHHDPRTGRFARGGGVGAGAAQTASDADKARILQGAPVAALRLEDAPAGGYADVARWAAGLFKRQGGRAVNPVIGEVTLNEKSARSSMGHGDASQAKKVAFAAVKDVIERGALVYRASHGAVESFYIAAPVRISGRDNIAVALVRRYPDSQRLYLHGVSLKENLLNLRVSTVDAEAPGLGSSTNSGDSLTVPHVQGKAALSDVTQEIQRLLTLDQDARPTVDVTSPEHKGQWDFVGYEERKIQQGYVDNHGNERTRTVGDWDNAETSKGSGQRIVNIYHLRHQKTGEEATFGEDTAHQAMGLTDDVAKRKAQKFLANKRSADRVAAATVARADREATSSKAAAYLALDERNPRARGTPSLDWETTALQKDGKWYVLPTEAAEAIRALKATGWTAEQAGQADGQMHKAPVPVLFLRPDAIPLLKATLKKLVLVPGYTKRDGTVVGPHQKEVHYNPEVLFADVAAGKGSHSQKKAHAKLAPKDWWQKLTLPDKAIAVMSLATDLQTANTAAADVSVWKKTVLSGKNPAPAQWAAFNALPSQKKAVLLDQVKTAVGVGHLKDTAPEKTAPATPQPGGQAPVFAPASNFPAPSPTLLESQPVDAAAVDLDAHAKLAALEDGPHWQKVALAELKSDPAWQKMASSAKLHTAIAHYHKLQSAASASAAMSVGKKAMLAGKVPSPSQYAALMGAGPDKLAKVKTQVGAEKFDALMAQAAAKQGPGQQAASAATASTETPAATPSIAPASTPASAPTVGPAHSQAPPDANTLASTPVGPKDGDTKQGSSGVLVFKDGRWHKVNEPTAPAPTGAVKVSATLYVNKTGDHNKQWSISTYGAAVRTEWGKIGAKQQGLTKRFDSPSAAKAYAKQLIGEKLKGGYSPSGLATHQHAALLDADTSASALPSMPPPKSPTVASAQPLQPKPAPKVTKLTSSTVAIDKKGVPVFPLGHSGSMDEWKQVGKQLGSNLGGKFVDPTGQAWYVKFPRDENRARNELLAAKFYEMFGVPGQEAMQVRQGETVGIASRWIDGHTKATPEKLKAAPGAVENFPIDAWLANWDVVGATHDNLLIGSDGKAVRIDAGGSLLYRAQGEPKGREFASDVPELDSMTDPKKNGPAAAVFAGATKSDFLPALEKLALLKPSQIGEMVDQYGPKDKAFKTELVDKLIARRAFILNHYGIDDPSNKPPVDETKIVVDSSRLPPAIDFSNINGKPLSSKAHVNDQNTKDSQALAAFAAQGNLTAVKGYQYDAVDKETGESLGKKSILQHPANLIKKQWGETVQALQSIAYPAVKSLSLPALAGAIHAFFSPKHNIATIADENVAGFFMKIGDADNIPSLAPGVKPFFLKSTHPLIAGAKEHYAGYSKLVRKFISSVQSSGWINHVWSQGHEGAVSSVDVPIHKLASDVYKNATEMPEGAILMRNMIDPSQATVKALLAVKPGAVLQNTDSMCTSFKSDWDSFGDDIKLKITCAKGSKALLSWGSGHFSSEKEITTLPGARFVITAVTKGTNKKGKGVTVECLMLPPSDAYLAEVDQLAALGKSLTIGSSWNPNTTTASPHPWPNRSVPRLLVARMSFSPSSASFAPTATPCFARARAEI